MPKSCQNPAMPKCKMDVGTQPYAALRSLILAGSSDSQTAMSRPAPVVLVPVTSSGHGHHRQQDPRRRSLLPDGHLHTATDP